mmetsp:Transcript_19939/g.42023  ORF Transcript_19939/g.42023 Transcript_19939/m.42023 type:complete len:313 (+) Transcript_19939:864-1802(+)
MQRCHSPAISSPAIVLEYVNVEGRMPSRRITPMRSSAASHCPVWDSAETTVVYETRSGKMAVCCGDEGARPAAAKSASILARVASSSPANAEPSGAKPSSSPSSSSSSSSSSMPSVTSSSSPRSSSPSSTLNSSNSSSTVSSTSKSPPLGSTRTSPLRMRCSSSSARSHSPARPRADRTTLYDTKSGVAPREGISSTYASARCHSAAGRAFANAVSTPLCEITSGAIPCDFISSSSKETARSHSPARAHAPMAALITIRSTPTPSSCICCSSRNAPRHSPARSHAEITLEYVIVLGCNSADRIISRSESACP